MILMECLTCSATISKKMKKGNIWIGTDGGVAICDQTKNPVDIKVLNYSSGLPDNIVKKILKGRVMRCIWPQKMQAWFTLINRLQNSPH